MFRPSILHGRSQYIRINHAVATNASLSRFHSCEFALRRKKLLGVIFRGEEALGDLRTRYVAVVTMILSVLMMLPTFSAHASPLRTNGGPFVPWQTVKDAFYNA